MSDVMFYGVLRMPYEMSMADEISRIQFYGRAQQAADRVEHAESELNAARADLEIARKRDEEWHEHTIRKALELSDVVAELNAAHALLRDAFDEIDEISDADHEISDRIRNYLDACDTLEGK